MQEMQLLPIAALRKLSVDEQDKLAKLSVGIEKAADAATKAHKLSFPAVGKVVCIFEERLNVLKGERKIASNTSLAAYWESVTKAKLNNHALSCAVAFGGYVRSELIDESHYDKNTAQCLELAASICTAVGGDVSHEAVARAASELEDRSKDSAKNLKAILAEVKTPTAMSVEAAQAAIARLLAQGHLNVVIAAVGAEIAHIEDSEVARNAYFGIIMATDMFAANVNEKGERRFDDKTMGAWATAYDAAQEKSAPEKPADVKPATPATPTPAPAPEAKAPAPKAPALAKAA